MKDTLNDALGKIGGFDYVEFRHRRAETVVVSIVDGNVESAVSGTVDGTGVRVLHNGAWGFAATTLPTLSTIVDAANEAGAMAKKGSAFLLAPVKLAETQVIENDFHAPYKIDLCSVPIEEKLGKLVEASDWAKTADKVVTRSMTYYEQIQEVSFVNSEGSAFTRSSQKPTLVANCVVADQGKARPSMRAYSKTCGAEFFDLHDPLQAMKDAHEQGKRLLHAQPVTGGSTKVVLSPEIVGLLAHEAIGHTAESDLVIAGSFLKDKVGEKVASELVTLVDAPVVDTAAGWIPIDDEGVVGKRVEIIKNGVLNEYMVNRDDAVKLGLEPTGNARAYAHRDIPIVRMRNTFIEPGTMTEEELIEITKDGYYLKGAMGGQADFNGEFMFGSQEALEIKNGELTGISFVGPSISGNSFDVLQSVTGASKLFVMDLGAGMCGKGQPAKVDAGGPILACTALLGGQ